MVAQHAPHSLDLGDDLARGVCDIFKLHDIAWRRDMGSSAGDGANRQCFRGSLRSRDACLTATFQPVRRAPLRGVPYERARDCV
jgi:hypothetical protein